MLFGAPVSTVPGFSPSAASVQGCPWNRFLSFSSTKWKKISASHFDIPHRGSGECSSTGWCLDPLGSWVDRVVGVSMSEHKKLKFISSKGGVSFIMRPARPMKWDQTMEGLDCTWWQRDGIDAWEMWDEDVRERSVTVLLLGVCVCSYCTTTRCVCVLLLSRVRSVTCTATRCVCALLLLRVRRSYFTLPSQTTERTKWVRSCRTHTSLTW